MRSVNNAKDLASNLIKNEEIITREYAKKR